MVRASAHRIVTRRTRGLSVALGVTFALIATTCKSGEGALCVPGAQVACACPGTKLTGVQTCAANGNSFGACQACPSGGSTGGTSSGGASPSTSASGMPTTGVSTGASTSTGMMLSGATPLVVDSLPMSGTFSVSAPNFFRIQATAASKWQWTTWLDLENGGSENLASTLPASQSQSTDLLFEPFRVQPVGGPMYGASDAGFSNPSILLDATPAGFYVATSLGYAAVGNFGLVMDSWIFPNGRVVWTIVPNPPTGNPPLSKAEYNYVSVNPNLANGPASWSSVPIGPRSAAFSRVDGPAGKPSVLTVDTTTPPVANTTLSHDSSTNVFMDLGPNPSVQGLPHFTGVLQLCPDGESSSSLAARAADILNPGLDIIQGGTGGYSSDDGGYFIQADPAASTLVFGTTSSIARYSPVFIVRNFKTQNWKLSRNGQVIVSSTNHVGTEAVGWGVGGATIIIVLEATIPAGAPDSERLLTLETM